MPLGDSVEIQRDCHVPIGEEQGKGVGVQARSVQLVVVALRDDLIVNIRPWSDLTGTSTITCSSADHLPKALPAYTLVNSNTL